MVKRNNLKQQLRQQSDISALIHHIHTKLKGQEEKKSETLNTANTKCPGLINNHLWVLKNHNRNQLGKQHILYL